MAAICDARRQRRPEPPPNKEIIGLLPRNSGLYFHEWGDLIKSGQPPIPDHKSKKDGASTIR